MGDNTFDQFDAPAKGNTFDQFDAAPAAPAKPSMAALRPEAARSAMDSARANLERQIAGLTPAQKAEARRRFNADPRIQEIRPVADRDESALSGFAGGLLKPLDNLSTFAMKLPGMAAIDRLGQRIGLPSQAAAAAGNSRARQNNTRTGYQTLGNIAGTLPTAALPGGPLVQGAASGALLSDAHDAQGVLTDATVGAVLGKGGQIAGKAIGGVIAPKLSPAIRKLAAAKIPVTIGQLAQSTGTVVGKGVRGIEDKARSIPGLGVVISGARDRGSHALNRAVAEDVVSGIGAKLPKGVIGHELIDHAETALSDRYKDVVPRLVGTFDQEFAQDLAGAKAVTNVLPTARQSQFRRILIDVFGNRATNEGKQITGQNLKDAESRLTKLASDYAKSTDADQRIMAESLFRVRQALRALAVRSDPSGSELQAINQGWAKLIAMKKAGGSSGIITPKSLQRVAEKTGFNRDLARAAAELMPDHVPNSGTADRAAQLIMLKDALGAGAAGGAAFMSHPGPLIAGAAAAAPYTQIGQKAINRLMLTPRSAKTQALGDAVKKLSDLSPSAVAALFHQPREKNPKPSP